MTTNPKIKAYSYLRFSTPEQTKGDSFRRQTTLAQNYAAQHGLELDDSLTFHDLGVSAFRGANAEVGRLADFREAVRLGQVPVGSYLLVESLDRLSRLVPRKALRVLEEIIELGIVVVTLTDQRVYTTKVIDSDPTALMMAILTFMRSHEESETKSRRLKAAWQSKRQEAIEKGQKLTAVTPAWLSLNTDRTTFTVIEERAEIVRSIFHAIANGVGLEGVAKELNARKVPVFGRGSMWRRSYIQKLRDNPAVVGRFVPHVVQHTDAGKTRTALKPIENYFPAIIDLELFEQVQAMAAGRVPKTKNQAGSQHVLAGMAKCPACGATMTRVSKGPASKGGKPKLVCTKAKVGAGCRYRGIVVEQIEQAILERLDPVLAVPPLPDTAAERTLEGLRTSLGILVEEQRGLVQAIALKPVQSLLARLEAVDQELEKTRLKIDDLESAFAVSSKIAIEPRTTTLRRLLKDSPADTRKINASLRALFEDVIVDYKTGELRFRWKSGAESKLISAWPSTDLDLSS